MTHYYGTIKKRGDKLIFIPVSEIEQVSPAEEDIFPQVSEIGQATPRLYRRPGLIRPAKTLRRKGLAKTLKQAEKATKSAQKGIITTRAGTSVAQAFYHKKSYSQYFANKSRITFFDVQPDPDGIFTNIPEPYFRSEMVFLGIKVDIEPTPLQDKNDTYAYLSAVQTLTNSTVQLRINDNIPITFSFKDIAPVIETDVAGVGTDRYLTIHFRSRPMVEFGDIIKSNFFKISKHDRAYLVVLSDTAFPALGAGAIDFNIKVYLYARAPKRLLGG